ncbi:MAG: NAD(+) diphosphatase [Agarilytica sp.]
MTFVPAENSVTDVSADLLIVINRGRLMCKHGRPFQLLSADIETQLPAADHRHYLGHLDGKHCFAVFFSATEMAAPNQFEWHDLRAQLGLIEETLFNLAGRALQITRWYREHQFCGVCGQPTRQAKSDRALVCSHCEHRAYPRISPCVIGLVKHGDRCLLARGVRTPEGVFTTLAGFIEAGETAEEAFAREVYEEVGLRISNIRYVCSQPWPFPSQLMLGFYAECDSEELNIDEREIIEAAWFEADKLPNIPPMGTIAGKLIHGFVSETAHS